MEKQNKIIKYGDFILETKLDTPESYIKTRLVNVKRKIENMFKEEAEDDSLISFRDLNMNLISLNLSNRTMTHQNLIVKFTDEEHYYNLLIRVDLSEIYNNDKLESEEVQTETEDSERAFSPDSIKKCYIKFRKYDNDNFELISEIDDIVKIDDIDEEFLVDLKVKIDDTLGESEETDEIGIEFDDESDEE